MPRRWAVAATLVALLLGMAASFEPVDNVTWRVMGLVRDLPWSAAVLPHWNPAPMGAWSVRPLSVLLLKVYDLLLGGPTGWATGLKAWLSLWVLGAGGWLWLKAHRLPAWPALLVPLLRPSLFSAWLLPELDALGAGAALAGCAWFRLRRWWPAGLALAFALLLKESSGVVTLALLAAQLLGTRERRWLIPLGIGAAVWALYLLSIPAHDSFLTPPSSTRQVVVELSASQLLHLASPAGALLLLVGGLRRAALAWVAVGLLVVGPPLVALDYYEAYYYAPQALGRVLTLAVVAGLVLHLRRQPEVALSALLPWFFLCLVMLFGPTPREDLASRLLLVSAVPIAGLAWSAVPRLAYGTHRWPVLALAAMLGWYPVVGALDSTLDLRARVAVDSSLRHTLAAQDLAGAVVLFDNHVEWIGHEELAALGSTSSGSMENSSTLAWVDDGKLPRASWGRVPIQAERDWLQGRRIFVALSTGNVADGLAGDFAWTRRPWGTLESMHGGANLLEDAHFSATRPLPSPLERLCQERGERLLLEEVPSFRLPAHLNELPRRALTGAPVLERVTWRAALYRLERSEP